MAIVKGPDLCIATKNMTKIIQVNFPQKKQGVMVSLNATDTILS
jgi:hypothetical protein